jgi:CRP-like cAMP-binding protein
MSAPVAVLDADPALAEGLSAEELALARRALVLPSSRVDAEELVEPPPEAHGGVGLLIVDGAVMRHVELAERCCAEVLGPGDVLGPAGAGAELLDAPITYRALHPTTLVALDARFGLVARRWPRLAVNLHERMVAQQTRGAVHAAIAQLPRVGQRIVAVLWHLAERWGRVTPEGVVVSLDLTHKVLGRLVGAQRPSVTLAVGELEADGDVSRTTDGQWLLRQASRAHIGGSSSAS